MKITPDGIFVNGVKIATTDNEGKLIIPDEGIIGEGYSITKRTDSDEKESK